jgi:hypothetical protein
MKFRRAQRNADKVSISLTKLERQSFFIKKLCRASQDDFDKSKSLLFFIEQQSPHTANNSKMIY